MEVVLFSIFQVQFQGKIMLIAGFLRWCLSLETEVALVTINAFLLPYTAQESVKLWLDKSRYLLDRKCGTYWKILEYKGKNGRLKIYLAKN